MLGNLKRQVIVKKAENKNSRRMDSEIECERGINRCHTFVPQKYDCAT